LGCVGFRFWGILAKLNIFHKNGHTYKKDRLFLSYERRDWIPLATVAFALGLSPRTLRRYAAKGIVPGGRQESGRDGSWYFRREVIEKWWANLTDGTPKA
jgi:hypothetical protein